MFPQMVDSSGEKKGKEAAVAVTILLLVLSAFVLLIFYKSLAVRECLVTPAQAPNVLDERKGNEELTGIEEEPYEGAEIQPSGAPTPNIESIENEAEREHIQMLLWSKKAVLLLEYRKTPRSDCQADDCLYERSTGNSVIKEDFRVSLNGILKNGKMSATSEACFHISCIARILDLPRQFQSGYLQIRRKKILKSRHRLELPPTTLTLSNPLIDDWFENGGKTFHVSDYVQYLKANGEWQRRLRDHDRHSLPLSRCYSVCPIGPRPAEPNRDHYLTTRIALSLTNVLDMLVERGFIQASDVLLDEWEPQSHECYICGDICVLNWMKEGHEQD
ncbi:hypothetical protein MMC10_005520 [Thelotrema lepadinum]|nr:hypothetical protein [Thelotrema lepadinum]